MTHRLLSVDMSFSSTPLLERLCRCTAVCSRVCEETPGWDGVPRLGGVQDENKSLVCPLLSESAGPW